MSCPCDDKRGKKVTVTHAKGLYIKTPWPKVTTKISIKSKAKIKK